MYNYNEDLLIDKYALDFEWENQSVLFMQYAELSAQAIYERDKAKDQLEIVRSEIDNDIRVNFEQHGFDKKPTEAMVTAHILTNDRYKKYNNIYIESIKNMNILNAAKEGISGKKYALENLTRLWVAGYYSAPAITKEDKDIVKGDIEARNKELVRQKLNRTKKW